MSFKRWEIRIVLALLGVIICGHVRSETVDPKSEPALVAFAAEASSWKSIDCLQLFYIDQECAYDPNTPATTFKSQWLRERSLIRFDLENYWYYNELEKWAPKNSEGLRGTFSQRWSVGNGEMRGFIEKDSPMHANLNVDMNNFGMCTRMQYTTDRVQRNDFIRAYTPASFIGFDFTRNIGPELHHVHELAMVGPVKKLGENVYRIFDVMGWNSPKVQYDIVVSLDAAHSYLPESIVIELVDVPTGNRSDFLRTSVARWQEIDSHFVPIECVFTRPQTQKSVQYVFPPEDIKLNERHPLEYYQVQFPADYEVADFIEGAVKVNGEVTELIQTGPQGGQQRFSRLNWFLGFAASIFGVVLVWFCVKKIGLLAVAMVCVSLGGQVGCEKVVQKDSSHSDSASGFGLLSFVDEQERMVVRNGIDLTKPQQFTVHLKNVSGKPIEIDTGRVTASCGCTRVDVSHRIVPTGEVVSVTGIVSSMGKPMERIVELAMPLVGTANEVFRFPVSVSLKGDWLISKSSIDLRGNAGEIATEMFEVDLLLNEKEISISTTGPIDVGL